MKSNSMRWLGCWVAGGLLSVVTVGCGVPAENTTSQAVGTSGGTVTATTGATQGTSIQIPAGALASTVTITIAAGQAPTNVPADVMAVGGVVVFGPEGQTFTTPVSITIPTTSEGTVLYTRPLGGATWTVVEGAQYDAGRHAMVAQVAHFSEFFGGRMARDGGPAGCHADTDCATGNVCVMGACRPLGVDAGPVCTPHTEICNAVDDDCDGLVDEGAVCVDAGVDAAVDAGCAAPRVACGGACVDLHTDPRNCGSCGSACTTGSSCVSGVCVAAPPRCSSDSDCLMGQHCVSGACVTGSVDAGTDAGSMCTPHTEVCNGVDDDCDGLIDEVGCVDAGVDAGCAAPLTICGMSCADLYNDPRNCGSCGAACSTGHSCISGVCTAPGSPCASDSDCATGQVCSSGYCMTGAVDGGTCSPSTEVCNGVDDDCDGMVDEGCAIDAGMSCPAGLTPCGGACVDLNADRNNCGACGNACLSGHSCAFGSCM